MHLFPVTPVHDGYHHTGGEDSGRGVRTLSKQLQEAARARHSHCVVLITSRSISIMVNGA